MSKATKAPDRPIRRKPRRPPRSAATATPRAPGAPVTDKPPTPAAPTVGAGTFERVRASRGRRAELFDDADATPGAAGVLNLNGRERDALEDGRERTPRAASRSGRDRGW